MTAETKHRPYFWCEWLNERQIAVEYRNEIDSALYAWVFERDTVKDLSFRLLPSYPLPPMDLQQPLVAAVRRFIAASTEIQTTT